jgi:hypothetical protein
MGLAYREGLKMVSAQLMPMAVPSSMSAMRFMLMASDASAAPSKETRLLPSQVFGSNRSLNLSISVCIMECAPLAGKGEQVIALRFDFSNRSVGELASRGMMFVPSDASRLPVDQDFFDLGMTKNPDHASLKIFP